MAEALFEVFYCSALADGQSPAVVSAIAAQARSGNRTAGITGLLIFDGLHFLHHIEGPKAGVEALMGRITADPRHSGLRVIYSGELPARRCTRFDMGFAEPAESDDGDELLHLEGEAGLLRFLALRPGFDIQG